MSADELRLEALQTTARTLLAVACLAVFFPGPALTRPGPPGTMLDGGFGVLVSADPAQVSIVNDQGAIVEGETAIFTVSVSRPRDIPAQTVTASCRMRICEGPGSGQGSVQQELVFAPQESSLDCTFETTDNRMVEGSRVLCAELTGVSGAEIRPEAGQAQVVIEDDDREPQELIVVAGDGQIAQVGTVLEPLVVAITDGERPLADVTVRWQITTDTGGGARLASVETISDDAGQSSNVLTLGIEPSDAVEVTAMVDPGLAVRFRLGSRLVVDPEHFDESSRPLVDALSELCASSETRSAELDRLCAEVGELDLARQWQLLDTLSPRQTAAQAPLLLSSLGTQQRNLRAHLRALRSGQREPVVTVKGDRLLSRSNGWFFEAARLREHRPATARELGFAATTHWLTAGLDHPLADGKAFLGGALNHSRTSADFHGGGEQELDLYQLSAFATWRLRPSFHVEGLITWGQSRIEIERRLALPDQAPSIALGETDGDQLAVSLGATNSHQIARHKRTGLFLELAGGVDYRRVELASYRERGSIFDLVIEEQSEDSLLAALDLSLAVEAPLAQGWRIQAVLVLSTLHELRDDQRVIRAHFAADSAARSVFAIPTSPTDVDYLRWRGELRARTGSGSVFLVYESDSGRSDLDRSLLAAGLRWEWP